MRSSWGKWVLLAGMLAVLSATSGCSILHRGGHRCREPAMQTSLANGPGLTLPPGLEAPETRGAVRIPELKEPEQPRSARDPCLSAPPDYKTGAP